MKITKLKLIIILSTVLLLLLAIAVPIYVTHFRASKETIAMPETIKKKAENEEKKNTEENIEDNVEEGISEEKIENEEINTNEQQQISQQEKTTTQSVTTKSKNNSSSTNTTSNTARYYIKVNYGAQVVTIYGKDSSGNYTVPIKAMVCSTGTATPRSGVYSIPGRWRWGALFGGVYGQYVTKITGNILFHSVPYLRNGDPSSLEYWEYDKLGAYASAGCVRLTVKDARWIYENCGNGTKVEFYSSSDPGPLGKPSTKKISSYPDYLRKWDPTDTSSNNPWLTYNSGTNQEKPKTDTSIKTETTKPSPTPSTTPSPKPSSTPSTTSSPTPEQSPKPSTTPTSTPSTMPSTAPSSSPKVDKTKPSTSPTPKPETKRDD